MHVPFAQPLPIALAAGILPPAPSCAPSPR
ncbi:hypothetical protein FHW12_002440 [Dokdonella fugitiva]|uniref:Uncharacterized protein n=1 Tax=Dokdonella fugitiva TaxID=328517 RepID=A0A839F0S9_9GAMM|nr:hypothetical protein [Dokdonella fugitiva]